MINYATRFSISFASERHYDHRTGGDMHLSSVFYRASICEGGLWRRNSVCPSVRLSVCLSVTRVDCNKSKWCTADIFDTTRNGNHSATLTPTVVGGRRPLASEICAQSDPPPFEKRRLRHISAYNVSTVRDSEKSSIMTNIGLT